VLRARKLQQERFAGKPKCRANAQMSHGLLRTHCKLDSEGRELLRRAMEELHLSARAYDRILKVARTIANLAGSEDIRPSHVLESNPIPYAGQEFVALSFRHGNLLVIQFSSPDPCVWTESICQGTK
jgi:predicted ATPase with chaperone activity